MKILQIGEPDELASRLGHRLAVDGHQVEVNTASTSDPASVDVAARAAGAVIYLSTGWDDLSAGLDDAWRSALLLALRGSGKRLVYLSEASVVGDTGDSFGNEDSPRSRLSAPHPWRVTAEEQVMQAISSGVHSIVVRPALLHGHRAGGVTQELRQCIHADGAAPYIGDGQHRTSTLHVDDLVALISAATTRAPEGATYLAASAEVLTWRQVAESVSGAIQGSGETRSITVEEATSLGLDATTMTTTTVIRDDSAHRRLGWSAVGAPLGQNIPH